MSVLRWFAACILLIAAAAVQAERLPPEVRAALDRAQLPADALAVVVAPAEAKGRNRLSWRADVSVQPASIAKLATTVAALDLLGPAYTWSTLVYLDGPVRDGVLHGNLYIKGQGDPKLVAERLWLLLRRVQGLGARTIAGDIVLDRTAFELPASDPASFDGEPLRPYNAAPDALLLNFRSLVLTFTPTGEQAQIHMEPPLAALELPASVPLSATECRDWRRDLQADFSDPARVRFAGAYPQACGERSWPIAYADPASYAARAIAGMWRQVGGQLHGQVRDGTVPPALTPAFDLRSPPLADVVRDINKFSNNVMAQQLFLTLGLTQGVPSTPARSRDVLQAWWRDRLGDAKAPSLGNGSGLSRDERVTARQIADLLQFAWASPFMPELMASLPLAGVDGTLRPERSRLPSGVAHLKTGSLRDVSGVAGYVHAANGRRYVLVAIANHPRAAAARPAIEALVEWTARLH